MPTDDLFYYPEDHPRSEMVGVIGAVLVFVVMSVIYFAFPEWVTHQRQAPTEAERTD